MLSKLVPSALVSSSQGSDGPGERKVIDPAVAGESVNSSVGYELTALLNIANSCCYTWNSG